jgi:hypothetical protein
LQAVSPASCFLTGNTNTAPQSSTFHTGHRWAPCKKAHMVIKYLLTIVILWFVVDLSVLSQDLESLKIIPKQDFEYNSLIKYTNDTLEIVTCAKYVISPFGEFDNVSQLKSSLLKEFKILSQKTYDSVYYYYSLKLNNNHLLFSLDKDNEASAHSNIVKGIIDDNSVKTINNIQIGMSADLFFKYHFKSFPVDLADRFKIIIFDYCVSGIKHIYSFKDKNLTKIEYR